ncbi:serine/threonine-protein kinase tricorner [Tanacetum coccineum]
MERDWWSLGVIIYEMLIGYPLFCSDDPRMTCRKIINWRTCLKFPEEPKVTKEARDLICHLLCDVESRLGTRGVDEIKCMLICGRSHQSTKSRPWRQECLTSKELEFIYTPKNGYVEIVGASDVNAALFAHLYESYKET